MRGGGWRGGTQEWEEWELRSGDPGLPIRIS